MLAAESWEHSLKEDCLSAEDACPTQGHSPMQGHLLSLDWSRWEYKGLDILISTGEKKCTGHLTPRGPRGVNWVLAENVT